MIRRFTTRPFLVAAAAMFTSVLLGPVQGQGLIYADADDDVAANLTTSSGDPISVAIDQFNLSKAVGSDGLWRVHGADTGNMFGANGPDVGSVAGDGLFEGWDEAGNISGDYNSNGIVDAADFAVWRASLASATNHPSVSETEANTDLNFSRSRRRVLGY